MIQELASAIACASMRIVPLTASVATTISAVTNPTSGSQSRSASRAAAGIELTDQHADIGFEQPDAEGDRREAEKEHRRTSGGQHGIAEEDEDGSADHRPLSPDQPVGYPSSEQR